MRNKVLEDHYYDMPSKVSSKAKVQAKLKSRRSQFGGVDDLYRQDWGFKCAHCRLPVVLNPLFSGVNNRNHCPYCLWSRHLDLYRAGDRLSACKAKMQPVGLTAKACHKKYQPEKPGELMLIHECMDCGKLSINRIAADDDVEAVFNIFEGSYGLDRDLKERLDRSGIEVLSPVDFEFVHARLLGWEGHLPGGG